MKKLIFSALLLVSSLVGAFAQSATFGASTQQQPVSADFEARAKDATDRLNNVVQLSGDQYNQVLQVNRRYLAQPQAMPGGRNSARAGYGREQQLKSILTPEQWQMYQNAKAQGQSF